VLSIDVVLGDSTPGYEVVIYDTDYVAGAPLMDIVCGIGIVAGLHGVRQGHVRGKMHRCIAWSIWTCLCGLELYFLNGSADGDEMADLWYYGILNPWSYGKYIVVISTRLIWLCLLIDWTLSSTGTP